MIRILSVTALFACIGLASAQTSQPVPAQQEPAPIAQADMQADMVVTGQPADAAAAKPRTCVRRTGSRILAAQNARAERQGKPERCSGFAGRSYTSDELESTGHTDLADALRTLSPSIN